MPEITIKNLTISTADRFTLPIRTFDLLILIDPDPESWMPHPEDEEAFDELRLAYNDLIADELEGRDDVEGQVPENLPPFVETRVIWAGVEDDELYGLVAEQAATVKFSYYNVEDDIFAELAYFLQGLYTAHPKLRVAVVGATMEYEVMAVGNLAAELGFATTILTRYCISQDAFVDLDELFGELSEQRRLLRELGLPDIDMWKFLRED